MRKERFSSKRNSILRLREDGPFQVLYKINDNVYRLDLPATYGVSHIFNVCDVTPFVGVADYKDKMDLRTNPFQEIGPDGEPFWRPHIGSMTRRLEEEEGPKKSPHLWRENY